MGNIQIKEVNRKRALFKKSGKTCDHNYETLREYDLGGNTGDLICSNCFKVVGYR
ncbi:hypothetical protein [Arenibacter sp. S6351L]|jgi:hypothetical protein|uniref:hypothetical protein n=1 Tax=Arenibacter sp. S6351L TaxID=2926407 RepID=UPI001FF38C74|nr:hypothetical protein [Arenibacter sp. S6351L]MCK0133364.1 hypothetical protein [Arenibacter sp. S6351L]